MVVVSRPVFCCVFVLRFFLRWKKGKHLLQRDYDGVSKVARGGAFRRRATALVLRCEVAGRRGHAMVEVTTNAVAAKYGLVEKYS